MKPDAEIHLFYGKILDRAAKLGFVLLITTFVIYVLGLLGPQVPLDLLPQYWGQSLSHYLHATRIQTGWAWLAETHHSDYLNLLSLAYLALVAIFCYLGVIFRFFKSRETVLGIIAIVQVLVLALAASGILRAGGH